MPRPPSTVGPNRIGPYDLLLPLGSGGMATVYLAQKQVVEGVTREFAVKLMHAHLRGDPDWAAHLLHEAKIAARVRHPNVVQLVDVGDDPLGIYLVLDYVEGESLSGLSRLLRAQQRSLPPRISGRVLIDALLGLHAAHELRDESGASLNLVHRDFSPQNVLVDTDGVSRLTDFGIAKASDGQLTATGVLKGKLAYMSPQQARGLRVDRRCDVWAAGVIAWELVAGRRLYTTKNDSEVLLAVVSNTPPPLSEVAPNVPKLLSDVVASALQPELSARCPDARTFREELMTVWPSYQGLADQAELADFVSKAIAGPLEERRQRAMQARRSRSAPEPVAPPGSAQGVTPSTDSLVLAAAEPTKETKFEAVTGTRMQPARGYRAGAAALVVIAALGGAYAWVAESDGAPNTLPSVSAGAVPAPAPVASASLVVSSDKDLAAIRVGRRVVNVTPPRKRMEVPLLAAESGRALEVEATNVAGETLARSIGKDEGSVRFSFQVAASDAALPTQTPKPKTNPRSPQRPRPKPAPTDVLAPTPFR